jgi:hypothetical protein
MDLEKREGGKEKRRNKRHRLVLCADYGSLYMYLAINPVCRYARRRR